MGNLVAIISGREKATDEEDAEDEEAEGFALPMSNPVLKKLATGREEKGHG